MSTQPSDVQSIRNAIQRGKLELIRKAELERLREELEARMEEIEASMRKQNGEDNALDSERQALRRRLSDTDHELDDLDEDLEGQVEELRAELVHRLLEHFPEHKARQQERTEQLLQGRKAQHELTALERAASQVQHELEMALAVWEKRGQRGFLNRLFGTNPAITASKHLENAVSRAQGALAVVTELAQRAAVHPSIEHSQPVLEQFVVTATELKENAWSFAKFSESLAPHQTALREIMARVEQQREETRRLIASLEAEVDAWAEGLAQQVESY